MPSLLLKTEPGEYSFADLARDTRAPWEGVTSNAALKHLRTAREGQLVAIYHTGGERAIVGLARVVRGPYEDPRHPGVNDAGEPRSVVIDVEAVRAARTPLRLSAMKSDSAFAGFALLKQPRLSVVPVPEALREPIRRLAGF